MVIRRLVTALLLLVPLGTSARPARADLPQTVGYQAVLTDDFGVPLSGTYNLTFKVYLYPPVFFDLPIWQETQNGVQVINGQFAVTLGAVSPITATLNGEYHLGVTVNGGSEITPRIPLGTVPYAMGLNLPLAHTTTSSTAAFSVRNDGTGAAIEALGGLDVGNSSRTGTEDIFGQGRTAAAIQLRAETNGGALRMKDESGSPVAALEADVNGTGGYLTVYRGAGQAGFSVDGNYNGTGEPVVKIEGSQKSVTFDMSVAGDASVQLPISSIAASEMSDEPGGAYVSQFDSTGHVEVPMTVLSRTITAPAAGYVIATGILNVFSCAGNGSYLSISTQQDTPGALQFPISGLRGTEKAQAVFPVAAGPTTFHLIVRPYGLYGEPNACYKARTLTLLYVSKAYGAVTILSEPAEVAR